MSLTNVLNDFPYRPLFYLKRPWKFFQEIWWNLRAAFSRATKGYAWRDSAEMSEFLLSIIPPMLRDVAHSGTYPGIEPFETHEKWVDWCLALADVFESVQQENWEAGRNEWEEEFYKALEIKYSHPNLTTTSDMSENEAQEVCKLYWERERELWDERDKIIQNAFSELAKYYNMLWI